jgi:hypothetical protein
MTTPDVINGLFEFAGAVAGFVNCVKLYRDKQVRGFVPSLSLYFIAWGIWNCAYYPLLGQWVSLAGTIAITFSNGLYLALAIYFKRKEQHVIQNSTVVRSKGSGRAKESHS